MQKLDLTNQKIGVDQAKKLAEELKQKTTLLELDISNNKIGNLGTKAIVESIKDHPTLQKLSLCANKIGDVAANAIAKVINDNKILLMLDLRDNDIDDEGANPIAEAIKQNKTLQHLDMRFNKFGSKGAQTIAEAISQNTTLKYIAFSSNQISLDGAKAIAEAIRHNKNLRHLDIRLGQLDAKCVKVIADAIRDNKSLQHFALCETMIDAEGVTAIARAIKDNRTLQELVLNRNQIGDDGANVIAEALKDNKTLHHLDLRDNQIREKGAKAIAGAIKNNEALQKLLISRNSIRDEGAKAIAEALKDNKTLLHLNLSSCNVLDEGAEAFVDAIKQNTTLQYLDLSLNQINMGFNTIPEAAKQNYTIQRIDGLFGSADKTLERNEAISKYISSVQDAISKGSLEISAVEAAIRELESFIPGIGTEQAPFDDAHPIAEFYRLLNGMSYISQKDFQNSQYGFELLNLSFDRPHVQQAADQARGQALFVSSLFKEVEPDTRAAQQQLILYYYRNHLDDPHFSSQIKSCLSQLKDPNKKPDPDIDRLTIKDLSGAERLLPYDDLIAIAQLALRSSEDDHEVLVLKQLLQQKTYDPDTSHYLWQCPSVREQFKLRYSNTTPFRILENYIINPTSSEQESEVAKKLFEVPFQQFSDKDPTATIDEQQLNKIKPFSFANYLENKKQIVMATLNEATLLLDSKQLVTAATSVLNTSRTPFEQHGEETKTRQFFQAEGSVAQAYVALYKRLLECFKANEKISLLIISRLVESDLKLLMPIKKDIAAAAFPDQNETESMKLLQKSIVAELSQLSRKEIELMKSLSEPLKNLNEEQVIQMLDEALKTYKPK